MTSRLCLVLCVLFATHSSASAAIVAYTDYEAWENAVSGPISVEHFNQQTVGLFDGSGGNGSIDSSGSPLYNGFSISGSFNGDHVGIARGRNGYQRDGTQFLGWGQRRSDFDLTAAFGNGGLGPTVQLDLAPATFAIAFDWQDPDNNDSYTVDILGSNSHSFTNPPFATTISMGFWGVVSDTAISAVQFRSTTQGGTIDLFSIDNVRTTRAVPEPASLAIFSLAAMGLVGIRRCKQKLRA